MAVIPLIYDIGTRNKNYIATHDMVALMDFMKCHAEHKILPKMQ